MTQLAINLSSAEAVTEAPTPLTINGTVVEVAASGRTLLDVLREDLRLTGAKLGCGEGECGACTVLVDGRAVCACLQAADTLVGRQVETIEGLRDTDLGATIVDALAANGAVQCGFCTPGFVVAAAAHLRCEAPGDLDASIEGNLCRCTGYAKIRTALSSVAPQPMPADRRRPTRSRKAVLAEMQADPGLMPIAGGTDLLVRAHGSGRPHRHLDLTTIDDAAMTTIAEDALLSQVADTVGGAQIRNAGTIGGNIATASPAGDGLPALVALRARVEVDGPDGARTMPLAEFLVAPGRTALRVGELIVRIVVPKPAAGSLQVFRKVGPRRAQAISKLSLALVAQTGGGWLGTVDFAFGAVGPVPMTCPRTHALLRTVTLGDLDFDRFAAALAADLAPIDDFRSTKAYRLKVAQRLLWRELGRIWIGAPSPDRAPALASAG